VIVIGLMNSGLRAAFLFLLCLLAPHAVLAEERLDRLAADPQWAALLHLDEGEPLVRDAGFLLSLPNFSPAAELRATLDGLRGPEAATYACRFPARHLWLRERLSLPTVPACAQLEEFARRAPMQRVHLVFASEVLSQPSSMMGHLFLMLEGEDTTGVRRRHALSFFTEPVTFNVPKLLYDSLLAGMPGYFSLGPYSEALDAYVGREGRNLWEFPLLLSEAQRELVQAHLIELKQVKFTYFFQRYNCATLVKQLLAVARPAVLQNKDRWTTPKDVVRAAQAAGLLDTATARVAPRWALHSLADTLPDAQVRSVAAAVDREQVPELGGLSAQKAFAHRELAFAYNQYLVHEARRDADTALRYRRTLQQAAAASDDLQLEADARLSPLAALPDSQMAAGWLRRGGQDALLLEFLPTSHRLEDRNDMYFAESGLQLFDLALRASKRSLRVERATVYNVESLLPRDALTGGWSGRFRIGYEPQAGRGLQVLGAFGVEGALGVTHRWARDVDAFALVGGGLGLRGGAYLHAKPSAGVVVRQVFDMKSIIELSLHHNGLGDGRNVRALSWTQAKYFGREWALVGQFIERREDQIRLREASLRAKRLF
jgi:Domain of unknown function (DUF4105)